MLIRYINGMKLKGTNCAFCDARRDGTLYRENIRWWVKLSCGHRKFKGLVKPQEILEAEGHLNQESEARPGVISQVDWGRIQENIEIAERNRHDEKRGASSTGKIYF